MAGMRKETGSCVTGSGGGGAGLGAGIFTSSGWAGETSAGAVVASGVEVEGSVRFCAEALVNKPATLELAVVLGLLWLTVVLAEFLFTRNNKTAAAIQRENERKKNILVFLLIDNFFSKKYLEAFLFYYC